MAKDKQQQEEVEQEVLHNTEEQDVAQEQDQSEEKTELEKVQEELQAEKDRYLRLFAEFENYKRRTAKERVELFKTAGEGILKDMLPVLDDFDRALVEINKSDDEQLTAGVTLISNKLRNTLKSKNLEEVEVEAGDTFNADDHEAVTQIPAPNDDMKGKIIDVIEKGYN